MDLAASKDQQVDFMKKYLPLFLLALGLVAFVPQKAKADGYFGILVYRSDPLIASLIRYTMGATIRATIAITITTIIRTATGTGATTVIGTTMMMMIRPKRF